MKTLVPFKTTNPPLLISVLLVCFALLPRAQAVVPAPDGGYPNGTTAEGTDALLSLTSGVWNTALGFEALNHDTIGKNNTATGLRVLFSDTSGSNNTANGVYALYSDTIGWYNNGVGAYALSNNTEGNYNTANGYSALYHNTTGSGNVAIGFAALHANTTAGINSTDGTNVAVGYQALQNNTGSDNNAVGHNALQNNATGFYNNAFGWHALNSNVSGSDKTAIGDDAGEAIIGDGNVCIGATIFGVGGIDNTTWIRNVYNSVASGRAVYVDSDNKIGTLSSSRRYKDEITPMAKASEAILSLRPVSFRYKKEVDPTRSLSFGLIAEEVAQVDLDLVTSDREGKPETVRYEAVNAMLLNEFLKEHRKVEELEATVAQQQKGMEILTAQLKEQAAQIQKVSTQPEAGRSAPQVVLNNP